MTHTFSAGGPIGEIRISASGVVDTFDTAGVTRSTAERLPIPIFLRETPLTATDAAVRAFAKDSVGAEVEVLASCMR